MNTCPNCKFHTAKLLTKNEVETLNHMLLGMSYREIGGKLFKSPKTIATFWYRAKKKLEVNSLFGVYRKWTVNKMLEVPDMRESVQFRAGYSQALTDVLNPDLSIFEETRE